MKGGRAVPERMGGMGIKMATSGWRAEAGPPR